MTILPLRKLVDPARPITYGIVQAGPDVEGGVKYIRPADMSEAAGVLNEGSLLRTDPRIASSYARASISAGDVIVSIGPSFGKVMVVPPSLEGANLTQGTARLAPAHDVSSQWLYWALQSRPARGFWMAVAAGGTFKALNLGPLGETPLTVPKSQEQRRIAAFLDDRVDRIDRIIAARREQVAAIDESFASSRRAAVLGSTAARKVDTDLPWARNVGAGWDVRQLRHLAQIGTGHTPSRSEPDYWVDCSIPWLTTTDVHRFRRDEIDSLDCTEICINELGLANSAAALHPRGTVALSRTASAGFSIKMDVAMATSQDFVVWTCGPDLEPDFLLLLLRVMRPFLLGFLATGSTHKTIYFPDLQDLRVAVPSLALQRSAIDAVATAARQRQRLSIALKSQIDRLADYKSSLITAAVSGELDVTTAGSGIPG